MVYFSNSKREAMDEEQAETDDSVDASEGFQPKSPAMKRWKKGTLDHEDGDSLHRRRG